MFSVAGLYVDVNRLLCGAQDISDTFSWSKGQTFKSTLFPSPSTGEGQGEGESRDGSPSL
jgi:hypothetical protein